MKFELYKSKSAMNKAEKMEPKAMKAMEKKMGMKDKVMPAKKMAKKPMKK